MLSTRRVDRDGVDRRGVPDDDREGHVPARRLHGGLVRRLFECERGSDVGERHRGVVVVAHLVALVVLAGGRDDVRLRFTGVAADGARELADVRAAGLDRLRHVTEPLPSRSIG